MLNKGGGFLPPPFNLFIMINFESLLKIHNNISEYQEYIDSVYIRNTTFTKIYPNFRIEIEWNDKLKWKKHSDWYFKVPPKGFNLFNDYGTEYYQINCDDFYDSGVHMLSIYEIIQSINKNIEVIISYKSKIFCNAPKKDEYKLSDFDLYIEKEKRKIIDNEKYNLFRRYEKEINEIHKKYRWIKGTHRMALERIEKLINSRKNSYIISKLKSGEFKAEDVKNYPELIEATDELQKLKMITGTR